MSVDMAVTYKGLEETSGDLVVHLTELFHLRLRALLGVVIRQVIGDRLSTCHAVLYSTNNLSCTSSQHRSD